jgi:hypothetical protein
MARRRQNAKAAKNTKNGGATVGYEAQLWQMADALRGSMDAAEYEHVVPLYRHQEQAPEVGRSGRSFVVTTGTGSGKTEASREAGAMFQFLFRFWRREWPAVPFDEIRKRSRLLVIDDQEFRSRQSG